MHRNTAFPAPAEPGKRDSTLSMAVLVYLGVGISSYPTRLPDALSDYFGKDRAEQLAVSVEDLLKEAWLSRHDWGTADLAEATRCVREMMGTRHPELTNDAAWAVSWDFAYSNK